MDSDAGLIAVDRRRKRSRVHRGESPTPSHGSYPDWVMLDCFPREPRAADSSSVALAYEYASTGDRIGVGLATAPPPSTSYLIFDWDPRQADTPTSSSPEDSSRPSNSNAMAVAAHRNSILLRFFIDTNTTSFPNTSEEFFVYQVCPSSAYPPSLKRLPACRHDSINFETANNIGILCREDDDGEFVVAHLTVTVKDQADRGRRACPVKAALCSIRCGHQGSSLEGSWRCTKRLPIRNAEGEKGDDLIGWRTEVVVPFGNCICWVDYLRGILICDVFSPSPELHYVPLPVDDPYNYKDLGRFNRNLSAVRSVCVTKEEDGGDAIRFVDVVPCTFWIKKGPSSRPVMNSWRLARDRRTWVEDAMMTYDQFFAFTRAHKLPCTHLEFPLVDINDPQTIYFAVREEERTSLIAVNNSSATLVKTTPTLFRRAKSRGRGRSYNDIYLGNLYYSQPFLTCELSGFKTSGEGDCNSGEASSNLPHGSRCA